MVRKYGGVVFILFIALILRLWKLSTIPLGFTHDEMGYIFNSYAVATTGRNVFGEFLPFLTWMTPAGFPFMPVPIYLMAPLYILFTPPFAARLGYGLLGTISVYFVYSISKTLFRKETVARIAGLLFAVSSWHLHFSRSAYDPTVALFFYLLAIVLYLKQSPSYIYTVGSVLAFFLAIVSYRGMSMLFIPIAFVLVWYTGGVKHLYTRKAQVFAGGIVLCAALYAGLIIHYGTTFSAEARTLLDHTTMQEFLDQQLREATGPLYIKRFFLNKPLYIFSKLRENYLRVYSFEYLLLYTEPLQIYSIWTRGRIYAVEGLFLLIGFVALWKKKQKEAFFLTSLCAIGGIPGAFGGMPYSARTFFLSAVIPIISAYGIVNLISATKPKGTRLVLAGLIGIVFVFSVASYLFDYYNRYAHTRAESWAKSIKDVSVLVAESQQKGKRVLLSETSFGDFVLYAFYSGITPQQVQQSWKQYKQTGSLAFIADTVSFYEGCMTPRMYTQDTGNTPELFITREDCYKETTPSSIIRDYYFNPIWRVYEADTIQTE